MMPQPNWKEIFFIQFKLLEEKQYLKFKPFPQQYQKLVAEDVFDISPYLTNGKSFHIPQAIIPCISCG